MKKMNLCDAFPPVDERFERSIEHALTSIRGQRKNVRRAGRLYRAILVAAMLVILLAAAAFASSIIRSASTRMISEGLAGDPITDYEKVGELARIDSNEQSVVFDSGSQARVSLEQAYYNGEQLILGLGYAGSDMVEFYERGDTRFQEVHPREIRTTVDGKASIQLEDIDLERHFQPDIVAALFERLDEAGWAGLFWQEVWLGDGIYIPNLPSEEQFWDGTRTSLPHTRLWAVTDRDWNVVGAGQRYIEIQSPLPAAIRNQEVLRIMIEVYSRSTWCYCEGTAEAKEIYIGYGDTEVREVEFEIPLNGAYSEKTYRAEMEFPNHTASVSMVATPVYAQMDITNHMPTSWIEAWAEHEGKYVLPLNLREDVAFDYRILIERDGIAKPVSVVLDGGGEIENLTGRFVIPDGATAIVIRPVYANSGEHPDEDVRIELEP